MTLRNLENETEKRQKCHLFSGSPGSQIEMNNDWMRRTFAAFYAQF